MSTKRAVYDIASFKASPDETGRRGEFEALVSVFGNVDLQGDRVVKGAFSKSLTKWRKNGHPLPIVWSHDWGNPFAHIGAANPNDVKETDEGLVVKGSLDLANPFAAQVFGLLEQGTVRGFSFGYSIGKERTAKDGANELLELDIIEAGPTLKGANEDAQLRGVKLDLEMAAFEGRQAVKAQLEAEKAQLEAKAGRRISRATEAELSTAIDGMEKELVRLRGLLSSDSGDEKVEDEVQAIGTASEAQATGTTGDDDLLRLKTAIKAAYSWKGS